MSNAPSSLRALALVSLSCVACEPNDGDGSAELGCSSATVEQGGVCVPDVGADFPEMVLPPKGNPTTPEKVELGWLLFFDPILSGTNDVSCAHCHHPDLAMGDRRALSMGIGGVGVGPDRVDGAVLGRNAPTVWNAAFSVRQFWDGRVETLEEQALGPLESELEMAAELPSLRVELGQIDDYAQRFEAVFGPADPVVTPERVAFAIAAFERTVLSVDAPYDRFVAGDEGALTAEQVAGWELFSSDRLGCVACHAPPTFGGLDFAITGVPTAPGADPDEGRQGITADPADHGAFKVPTLRNAAVSAPYMHNGAVATFDEVLDFYAAGAGTGYPGLDPRLAAFSLTSEERAALSAFLESLVDESAAPPIPPSVPSGISILQ